MRRFVRFGMWFCGVCVILITALLIFAAYLPGAEKVRFGATYSVKYARDLGMDPWWTYKELSAIGIRDWRVPVYWDMVEYREGVYDFRLYDKILRDAEKNGSRVILVVGRRVPRWPECHVPEWAKRAPLDVQNEAVKKIVATTVKRYRRNHAIIMWQVENEPLLGGFGDPKHWQCPPYTSGFFWELVEIVHENDPSGTRKIITTESGELGFWFAPSRIAMLRTVEGIGFSFYRRAWTNFLGREKYRDYFRYPAFYRLKAWAYRLVIPHLSIFISELQAEPWGPKPFLQMTIAEQHEALSPQKLREIIYDSKRTGFDRVYLWGVESALYLKHRGHPEYWDIIKETFKTNLR
ncbi:MAG: beta-galactosidase [bacterium]|nr:beta-galactosidase [bacterium]